MAETVAQRDGQLLLTPGRMPEDDPFVKLMVSFYFKGGHPDQGVEFAHKSFREYLFAEHIVETLNLTRIIGSFPIAKPLSARDRRWPF
jgi:hypothetical protein